MTQESNNIKMKKLYVASNNIELKKKLDNKNISDNNSNKFLLELLENKIKELEDPNFIRHSAYLMKK